MWSCPPSPSPVRSDAGREPRDLGAPEALPGVVVDEPGCLHERVADRRAYEAEPAPAQVSAQRARRLGLGGRRPARGHMALDRRAVHEAPEVGGEAAVLVLDLEEGAGVGDRRVDLRAVPDDAVVGEEPSLSGRVVARDLDGIEAVEGLPVAVAAPQDGRPGDRKSTRLN